MKTTWRVLCALTAINFIAGCATNTPTKPEFEGQITGSNVKIQSYQGRLSLRIASEPPQSLYAGFSLSGDSQTGNLALNSPLGNTLAQMVWTPHDAVLKANSETKTFPTASALIASVTGTVIPLNALFDWLAGKNTPAEGWEIDLTGMNLQNADDETAQRLVAKRVSPLPAAELRIVIEK